MSITPFKPVGIGQVAAMNVFKVTFSQALSTNPKLMAWDDYTMTTVNNTIIAGSPGSGFLSMIGGIGLLSAPSASWFPSAENAATVVDSATLLNGNTGYCLLSSSVPGAADSVYFNLDYKIESNLEPIDTMEHVIAVEYQYTGATPTVTWYANEGTEGSPSWTTLQSGAKGSAPIAGDTEIRLCNSGEGDDGTQTYKLSIPDSGSSYAEEIWLRDKT